MLHGDVRHVIGAVLVSETGLLHLGEFPAGALAVAGDRAVECRQRAVNEVGPEIAAPPGLLTRRLDRLGSQEEEVKRRLSDVGAREEAVRGEETRYQELVEGVRRKLEETAGLTRDEARRSLIEQMVDEARSDGAKLVRQIENEALGKLSSAFAAD